MGKAVGKAIGKKTYHKTARKGTPGAGGSGSGGHHFAVPKSRRAAGAVAVVSVSTAAAAVAEVMGGTATAKIAPLSSLSLAATIDGKSPTPNDKRVYYQPNAVHGTAASTATSTDVDTCADTDVATAAAAAVDMKEEDPLRALYFKSGPAVFPATVVGAGAACCKVRLCNASSKVIKVRSEGTTHPAVLRCRLYALLGLLLLLYRLLLLLYRLYALLGLFLTTAVNVVVLVGVISQVLQSTAPSSYCKVIHSSSNRSMHSPKPVLPSFSLPSPRAPSPLLSVLLRTLHTASPHTTSPNCTLHCITASPQVRIAVNQDDPFHVRPNHRIFALAARSFILLPILFRPLSLGQRSSTIVAVGGAGVRATIPVRGVGV